MDRADRQQHLSPDGPRTRADRRRRRERGARRRRRAGARRTGPRGASSSLTGTSIMSPAFQRSPRAGRRCPSGSLAPGPNHSLTANASTPATNRSWRSTRRATRRITAASCRRGNLLRRSPEDWRNPWSSPRRAAAISPRTSTSLRRVRALRPRRLFPGHGPIVEHPEALIDEYLRHREERERQIVAALSTGGATVDQIVARVYRGLNDALVRAAGESVTAHLIKLQRDGRVTERRGTWTLLDQTG